MKTIFAALITLLSFSAIAQDAAVKLVDPKTFDKYGNVITKETESDTVTISLTQMQTEKLLQADKEQMAAAEKINQLLEFILDANNIDRNTVINFKYQEQPNKAGALVIVKKKGK